MTAEANEGNYSGLKVLVVDDELTFRELMREVLGDLGAKVVVANNGFEGLMAYEKEKPDVVFTDYSMPGMNGLEMSHQIQKLEPLTPIIVLTASMYDELDISSYDVNIVTIVKKPFKLHEIPEAIDKAIATTK